MPNFFHTVLLSGEVISLYSSDSPDKSYTPPAIVNT